MSCPARFGKISHSVGNFGIFSHDLFLLRSTGNKVASATRGLGNFGLPYAFPGFRVATRAQPQNSIPITDPTPIEAWRGRVHLMHLFKQHVACV
jgi:hypothetical protein